MLPSPNTFLPDDFSLVDSMNLHLWTVRLYTCGQYDFTLVDSMTLHLWIV